MPAPTVRRVPDAARTLDPDAPAIDGVRVVLAESAARLTHRAQRTLDGDDPADLHQLRVAMRATRSILTDMKSVVAPAAVAGARRELAWLGRVTGPARDLDVLIDAWPRLAERVTDDPDALDWAGRTLRDRRRYERSRLVEALGSERAGVFLASWTALLADPSVDLGGKHAARPLGSVVERRLVAGHARLLEHGSSIRATSPPAALHELRTEVKVVRYVAERFGDLMDERARRRYVKRLRRLQRVLGAHQDADVFAIAVRRLAADAYDADAGPETVIALGRAVEQLVRRRAAARAEFDERFAAFATATTAASLDAALASVRR